MDKSCILAPMGTTLIVSLPEIYWKNHPSPERKSIFIANM